MFLLRLDSGLARIVVFFEFGGVTFEVLNKLGVLGESDFILIDPKVWEIDGFGVGTEGEFSCGDEDLGGESAGIGGEEFSIAEPSDADGREKEGGENDDIDGKRSLLVLAEAGDGGDGGAILGSDSGGFEGDDFWFEVFDCVRDLTPGGKRLGIFDDHPLDEILHAGGEFGERSEDTEENSSENLDFCFGGKGF